MNDAQEREHGDERLLAMAVAEATARGPRDLEQRVLARLGSEPVSVRPANSWIAAAALLLVGTAVVVAVSVAMRSSEATTRATAPGEQDPQSKKPDVPIPRITDANVPKRSDYAIDDRPAVDCIDEIGKAAGLPFASAVLEKVVRMKILQATPRQALAAVAWAAGAHLEQFGGVLAVVPGAAPAERTVTLRREAVPIHELFALVGQEARDANMNLVVAGSVTGDVAVDVTDCPGRDLVALLAAAVGAEVVGCGKVLAVVPKSQLPEPRVYFGYDRMTVAAVLAAIAKVTGVGVQRDDEVAGCVTVRARNEPTLDVLQAIAATGGCEIVRPEGKPVWKKVDARSIAMGWRASEVREQVPRFELDRAFAFIASPETFVTQFQLEGTVFLLCGVAPRRHVLAAIAAVAGGRVERRENGSLEFIR